MTFGIYIFVIMIFYVITELRLIPFNADNDRYFH